MAIGIDVVAIESQLRSVVQWVLACTIILLVVELGRFFSGRHNAAMRGAIEGKMVKEGVSEQRAEEEVKEEGKVKKREKKVARFALDEFLLIKELIKEVENASSGTALLDAAGKKLRVLKKEERIEKRLTRRLEPLYREVKKLATIEPQKKRLMEELLLEISRVNQQLVVLLGKGGQFEQTLNRRVQPGFMLEQKKETLRAMLQAAARLDATLLAGVKRLNELESQ